jgi:hypothetical protein
VQQGLPGGSGQSLWTSDETGYAPPWTAAAATGICASIGGHLPSERDYTEAIRQGLGLGSNNWLWTSDVGYGSYGTNIMLVQWAGTNTAFTDTAGNWAPGTTGNSYSYRCMWTNELR